MSLLQRLGIQQTRGAIQGLVGWQQAEGGLPHKNPLNTTQGAPGATTFNSVGVKTYPTWDESLDATVQTLRNGRYGPILKALKAGDPNALANAIGSSPWGTASSLVHNTIAGASGRASGGISGVSGGSVPQSLQAAGSGSAQSGTTLDYGSQGSAVALLTALQQQQPRTPTSSIPLQAPSFAAGPKLPNGAGSIPTSGGPAPRPDISNLLAVAAAAAGSGGGVTQSGATSDSSAPSAASGASGGGSYPSGGSEGSKVLELIHNDGSGQPGFGIKNGQVVNGSQVFSNVWAGHANHVHVAAGPKTVVALGKYAQSLGLHVGENPHFGGVTPVHVPGSYHYKGEAIDVSGTPQKMDAFAKAVEQYNRTRRLPS